MLEKVLKRKIRHARVRAKISWDAKKPRLCIFRSNVQIYAQLIDDQNGKTLCATSDLKIKKWAKIEKAIKVWEEIGKKALDLWIKKCVFDRWGFMYTGRVKALAEAARKSWLVF
jgi:large subunit ribosomal protein L18